MTLLKIFGIFIISSLVTFGIWSANTPIECVTPKEKYQLHAIQTALKLFYIDTKRFPTNEEGLRVLLGGSDWEIIKGYKSGGYIDELQNDRWGNPYHYLTYKQKSGVETAVIWTYGADGLPEGDEEKKDIHQFLEADKIFSEPQQ